MRGEGFCLACAPTSVAPDSGRLKKMDGFPADTPGSVHCSLPEAKAIPLSPQMEPTGLAWGKGVAMRWVRTRQPDEKANQPLCRGWRRGEP